MSKFDWPLMRGNLAEKDLAAARAVLSGDDPVLTQSRQVRAFEEEWSAWLGVKYSVFVNSGSSANLVTLAALRELTDGSRDEVILPALTWPSDVAAVLHAGLKPVFVDVDPRTLAADRQKVFDKLTSRTLAVFLTHLLGFCGLTDIYQEGLAHRGVLLLEDCCQAHGATRLKKKVGTFGLASNFSFYYGHHMTTVEGGMISTDSEDFYETCRVLRSHGLVREMDSAERKLVCETTFPDAPADFATLFAGYNVRGTEVAAAIGRSQLKRLDDNVRRRSENLADFLAGLDPNFYRTDYATQGSSSYALPVVLREGRPMFYARIRHLLADHKIEYRQGLSGGNQLRQPYLRQLKKLPSPEKFPEADHVHFYGLYVGNYPSLAREQIAGLCRLLNSAVPGGGS